MASQTTELLRVLSLSRYRNVTETGNIRNCVHFFFLNTFLTFLPSDVTEKVNVCQKPFLLFYRTRINSSLQHQIIRISFFFIIKLNIQSTYIVYRVNIFAHELLLFQITPSNENNRDFFLYVIIMTNNKSCIILIQLKLDPSS